MAHVWKELSKFRLSSSVVFTTAAGFMAAGWQDYAFVPLAAVTVGTMLAAGAAASFNQVLEIKNDRLMSRTKYRPLPTGLVSPQYAIAFGTSLSAMSGAVLWMGTDPLTTALGLGNIVLYSFVYTPLKQRTPLNTDVGAVVGAIPPIMGWTAATGGLCAAEPILLAAALFWWQLPHFYSMLWASKDCYAKAGYEMVSKYDPDGKHTARLGLNAALCLCAVPVASSVLGATSSVFMLTGGLASAWLAHASWRFWRDPNDRFTAGRVKSVSLVVVLLITAFFVLHARLWLPEEKVLWDGYAAQGQGQDKDGKDGACRWNPFADPRARSPASAAAVADAAAAVAAGEPAANAAGPMELLARLGQEAAVWLRARCAHELWYLPAAHIAAFMAADSWADRRNAAVDCMLGRTGAFVNGRAPKVAAASQPVVLAAAAPAGADAAAGSSASSNSSSSSGSAMPCLFKPLASLGAAVALAEGAGEPAGGDAAAAVAPVAEPQAAPCAAAPAAASV